MNIGHVENFLFSQSADGEGSRGAGDRSGIASSRWQTSFC